VISSAEQKEQANSLAQLWADYTDDFGEVETKPFVQLLSQGIPAKEIKQVLLWLPRSNYWGKPGKGQLDGPEGFRKAYSGIRTSYQNYKSKEKRRTEEDMQEEQDALRDAGSHDYQTSDPVMQDDEDFG
jgi:hypothetical protein